MELNLRKARKLESKISQLINKERSALNPDKSVRVNADVQTEVLPELVQARQDFLDRVKNIKSLIEARFLIRRLIGESNESSGINAKINEKVVLEHKLSTVNAINLVALLDSKELEDEFAVHRAALSNGGDRFGRASTSLNAKFLQEKDKENFSEEKVDLVKNIEEIEDKLLELNYNTKIKLDNNTVNLLKANSLV